ncbi:protein kinase domain-containing protein [Marisediminicola senii]|uniref:protein kinase domain-containing protein n=1 Tax=Marisediminicola senii TaxID=2711233 RepID=UPI0013EB351F|nr:protein kinase [Marisediminicola senii]
MDSIGGFRLVRRIGIGRRSDVYLGRAPVTVNSGGRSAAVKVFRSTTDIASIDAEIEALARSSSPHVLQLEDLATAPDGRPVLILQRLGAQTLAALLAERGEIDVGEAVTILVPIAQALAHLHEVGIAHGALSSTAVLFDGRGAPVLASLGGAAVVGSLPDGDGTPSLTPAQLAASAQVQRDYDDLTVVSRLVLAHTRPIPAVDQLEGWLADWRRQAGDERLDTRPLKGGGFCAALCDAVFELAPATPIRFGDVAAGFGSESPPTTLVRGRTASRIGSEGGRGRRGRRRVMDATASRPAWRSALHLPDWLDPIVDSAFGRARSGATPVSAGKRIPTGTTTTTAGAAVTASDRATGPEVLRREASGAGRDGDRGRRIPSRRPLVLAAVLAAALVAIALAILPPPDRSSGAPGDSGGTTVEPAAGGVPGPDAVAETGTTDSAGEPGGEAETPAPDPAAETGAINAEAIDPQAIDPGAIGGDDPAAAALALLSARSACLEQRSAPCLQAVDHPGSAAEQVDRSILQRISDGQDATIDPRLLPAYWVDTVIVGAERIGGSAIVTVTPGAAAAEEAQTTPASLLLVEGEAGWRIRDLILE